MDNVNNFLLIIYYFSCFSCFFIFIFILNFIYLINKKMSLNKLFSQCDDYLKKIDQKIRTEDYKRPEITEKNLSDLKILLGDFKKIVS
jgi:hypothetical protein